MVNELKTENSELAGKLKHVQHELVAAKNYSKFDNLKLTGVPATFSEVADASCTTSTSLESNDTTVTKVIELCQIHLDLKISKEHIMVAHCLLSRKLDKHLPIVVQFLRRCMRDNLYRAKKILKTHNDTRCEEQNFH